MKLPYDYVVLRYVHDPIAGEALNIGVLLSCPAVAFLDARVEFRYERFSTAFAQFDGERFKQVLRHFMTEIEKARDGVAEPSILVVRDARQRTASDVGRSIWVDQGLSFRVSEPMAGIGENMPALLESLFDRFVTSQYTREEPQRMSDDQVWTRYRASIPQVVARNLRPKSFETADYAIEFDHAFQNERWHVLQPISMDYSKASYIQEKAAKWLGAATELQSSPEAARARFYFLLHPPELQRHRDAYVKAKNILHKMPLEHEMFEEDDAPHLAEELISHLHKP